jgi:hypothetical protein
MAVGYWEKYQRGAGGALPIDPAQGGGQAVFFPAADSGASAQSNQAGGDETGPTGKGGQPVVNNNPGVIDTDPNHAGKNDGPQKPQLNGSINGFDWIDPAQAALAKVRGK